MYYPDLIKKREALKNKIEKATEQIELYENKIVQLNQKNEELKLKLNEIEKELESKVKKNTHEVNYLNFSNCEDIKIGLNNKTISSPVAICNLHQCFLSYKNIRKRSCVMKMCKHIEWIDDYIF